MVVGDSGVNLTPMCFEQTALEVMGFGSEEIRDIFKLLSGILQLGNIEFMTAGGAQITTKTGKRHPSVKGVPTWNLLLLPHRFGDHADPLVRLYCLSVTVHRTKWTPRNYRSWGTIPSLVLPNMRHC